ncbi:hypothetical protein ACFPK1_32815 [Actinomycetospora rhizophila]|uniref:Uncharacterized protein n=1 Tax=Actinomycetospora rhizophila TaxID=1416876 RepID=A0ABV9ZNU8_9PSEU
MKESPGAAATIGAEHERDLGLHLGLEQAPRSDDAVHCHVVEEHAEVRGVDAELGLHRGVRQPDLAPDHASAAGEAVRGAAALHGVGGVDVVGADEVADRGAGRSRGGGVAQAVAAWATAVVVVCVGTGSTVRDSACGWPAPSSAELNSLCEHFPAL